jgi:UDP-N-acetylmuramate dehydrogenase
MSDLSIQENVPLAPFTTLGIGGPARFLIRAATEEQIAGALEFAGARGCPVFVLGGGSNLLIADSGFDGLVLKIELRGIQFFDDENEGRIAAAAGESWDDFVHFCVSRGLAGIECLSGIPGTVGGAPIQNVGAYGEEACDVILSIRALDRETGRITEVSNADCGFAYRSSVFNTIHENRYVILKVALALRPRGHPRIEYPDLRKRFESGTREPSLDEVREAVLQIRKAKAMVLCENDPDSKSAGSFFKNPILSPDEETAVESLARARRFLEGSEELPHFPAPGGKTKLSAAWLVERAGFHKGYTHGNAGISTKHSLALINRGGATAEEMVELMRLIQDRVFHIFGVELHPEPTFIGIRGRHL